MMALRLPRIALERRRVAVSPPASHRLHALVGSGQGVEGPIA
jgi:hypothetical protein